MVSTRARRAVPITGSLAAALAIAVAPMATGSAAPSVSGAPAIVVTPTLSIHDVQSRIATLNHKAERITEAYDNARDRLKTARRQQRISDRAFAKDRAALAAAQARIARAAVAAYRGGGLSASMSLIATGTPQDYIAHQAGLQVVSRLDAEQVATAAAERRQVAGEQQVHDAQVTAQRKLLASIGTQRHQVQRLIDAQHALLGRLKAADRRQLASEQAAQAARQVSLRGNAPKSASYTGPASGAAATAVRFAYAQLGKPYVYGGAGPNAYDCSGLTMRAWGAAGVGLPHNAAAQQGSIRSVPLSAMQPGDLIFFGSPAYHVGIYIGNGKMIHAPHTGTVVQIMPVSYMSPSGAGRP